MFKLKRSIGWNFPANDDGQENGLNDPGIETFKDHPLSSLAREVLQNSSDAADGSNKPVQVHFEEVGNPYVGVSRIRRPEENASGLRGVLEGLAVDGEIRQNRVGYKRQWQTRPVNAAA